MRSGQDNAVNIFQIALGTVHTRPNDEVGPAGRRATIETAFAPRSRISARIAASSRCGLIDLQPGIWSTLHAGDALAQP